jgi:hypothetical protein
MFAQRPDYLLRVQGMSMQDAGILDGDLLAVHRTPEARNGQIVVARLDDEVTVKRFRRRSHRVQLIAENIDYEPIEVDLRRQELVIEGLGVGVDDEEPTPALRDRCRCAPPLRRRGFSEEFFMPRCGATFDENSVPLGQGGTSGGF